MRPGFAGGTACKGHGHAPQDLWIALFCTEGGIGVKDSLNLFDLTGQKAVVTGGAPGDGQGGHAVLCLLGRRGVPDRSGKESGGYR